MTASEILALYDAEMRADPPSEPHVQFERVGPVVRAIGTRPGDHFNCILFSDLTAADAGAVIAEQAAFFRARGAEVEWKVYGHDSPPDLGLRLSAAGFREQESETLMAFDLAGCSLSAAVPAGVEVRRVVDATDLADMVAATGAAFGRDDEWRAQAFGPRLNDPTLGLYVAYADGHPVAAGRLVLPPRRSFASVWGGGTVPAYRGRGIYRLLLATRTEEARRRGYRFLTVDAHDTTSRPILERLGFVRLTSVKGWTLMQR